MKRLALFSAIVLTLALFASLFMPVHGEAELYDKVLRLHVLANSDSMEDQELKLKVRDRIIAELEPILEGLESLDAVKTAVHDSIPTLTECAANEVAENGYSYDVEVTLTREEYPRKSYDAICFPAGEYTSLRVLIGEAEGENWWCVLFPKLCLSASLGTEEDNEEAFISAGLTEDQYKIVTETDNVKYKARFKILEVVTSIFGKKGK